MKRTEESYAGWYFLIIAMVIAAIAFALRPEAMLPTFKFFWEIIKKIIPVFILIFVLTVIINYFVSPQTITRKLGKESGWTAWPIAVITGIISTGPIYLWYPLLNEMQKHGVRDGLVAVFLYNRAVKIPLLPLMIYYFGVAYVVVLTVVMIIVSILQGMLVEKIVGDKR